MNNKTNVILTTQEKDLIERLKSFAETDLYIANKILSGKANEQEVKIGLYMCHTLGIK